MDVAKHPKLKIRGVLKFHFSTPDENPKKSIRELIKMNDMQDIIQIYEIQTPSEAETMLELGVDHIGSVILSQESWKVSSVRETIKLVAETDSQTTLIPLFSNPDAVFRALDYYQPDIVHFCEALTNQNGDISENCNDLTDLQEGVRKRFPGFNIMRAIPIAQPGMADASSVIELARMFEPVSDYFLTDTVLTKEVEPFPGQPGGFIGITGQTCDWDVAKELVEFSNIPVILAGGLSPDNVADGIRHTLPAGVDSCTATNALDGKGQPIRFKKDIEKVRRFVEAARNLEL